MVSCDAKRLLYVLKSSSSLLVFSLMNKSALSCILTQTLPLRLFCLRCEQIVFEGIRGPSFEGDIAIDDVSITIGKCKQENTVASAGKTGKSFQVGRRKCRRKKDNIRGV